MSIDNRAAAEKYITGILDAGDAPASGFDVEGIADRLYRIAGGTWDITHVDDAGFWGAVAAHDTSLTDEDRAQMQHESTTSGTDQILDQLIEAQEELRSRQDDAEHAMRDRDALIVQARKTGTSAVEIGRVVGMTRYGVYKILRQAGLSED